MGQPWAAGTRGAAEGEGELAWQFVLEKKGGGRRVARYAHPTTGSKHSLALNDYLEAQLFGCVWAEACGGCGEEGGGGGRG